MNGNIVMNLSNASLYTVCILVITDANISELSLNKDMIKEIIKIPIIIIIAIHINFNINFNASFIKSKTDSINPTAFIPDLTLLKVFIAPTSNMHISSEKPIGPKISGSKSIGNMVYSIDNISGIFTSINLIF
nr:hypothetical protein [Brachyspira hyodysenteriae]